MNRIGSTDLDVFPLCPGGDVFGWTAEEALAPATPLEDSVGAPDADLELLGSVSAP
jgi:hypothetical protein